MQQVDPRRAGYGLVEIVGPCEFRPGKLRGRNMDEIAAKQDPVLARVENVGHVAGSVPRYRTCRQVISQPVSVPDRGEQVAKTLQVRLVDKAEPSRLAARNIDVPAGG